MNDVLRHLHRAALLPDGAGLTDAQLIDAFRVRRDEAAFEVLVRRHGPMVLGVCRRILGNSDDADDAFQATFLVLVRKAASLKRTSLVGNWLYGVAYRTALKAKAMNARRRAREKEMSRPEQAPECGWEELSPLLDHELGGLPEHYRVPIVLCDLEGMTRKEAARRLGVPEGTLSGRLTTARRLLAKRLSRHGLALSGGALGILLARHAAAEGVPHRLLHCAVAASMRLAAGGAVAIKTSALMEGVLKSMLLARLKVASILLAVALVVAGAGLLCFGRPAVGQALPHPDQIVKLSPRVEEKRSLPRFLKHDHAIGPLAWGADGKTLIGITIEPLGRDQALKDQGGAVRVWDLGTGEVKRTLLDAGGKFSPWDSSVDVSRDGKTIAAAHSRFGDMSLSGEILLWDTATGKLKHTLEHGALAMRCVRFSPDGKWIASGTGGNLGRDFPMVKLWDVKTGKFLRSLDTTNKMAVKLAFSADGKRLAVVAMLEDRTHDVTVWDPATGKLLHTFGPEETIGSVAFVGDGKTLAGLTYTGRGDEMECTLKLWDVSSGELKKSRLLTNEKVRAGWGDFSFDGRTIALQARKGDEHVVTLWDVKTGRLFDTLAFPPDGERRERGERSAGRPTGYGLVFSRDGKQLATSRENKTIVVWDIASRGEPKSEK
jgi:RNA polymerase sigma factor (sigma-70 family)